MLYYKNNKDFNERITLNITIENFIHVCTCVSGYFYNIYTISIGVTSS